MKIESANDLMRPEFLETVACNLCGGGRTEPWGASNGFKIVRCAGCGLVFVNPRLNREGLRQVYGQNYFLMHTEEGAFEMRMKMYEIERKEMESFGKSGRVLDIGCSGGFFLSILNERWQKFGTEINPVAAEEARKKFGLDVRVGMLDEIAYPDSYFDVVSLRGVIEHFADPFAHLVEIRRILKEGGVLAINTPNIGSLCARIYGDRFRLVAPPYHIYYFSTRTMIEMLKKAGFKILRTRYFYLGTPYARWTDGFKILGDAFRLLVNPSAQAVSPAFFDNVVHVYAGK